MAGEEVERNKVYGMPSEEILDYFYDKVVYEREKTDGKRRSMLKVLGVEN